MSINKSLLFDGEARAEIISGVDIIANAVKSTMGPNGQTVVIERPGLPPVLTKDGVTVAHAINQSLPQEKIIYFGDTQHLPYGNKSSNKIIYYSEKITDFLLMKKCKAIVIACNSASAIAFKKLVKKTNHKCLLFNVINPVVHAVIDNKLIKKVGVIGTNATISTDIYKESIIKKRADITVSSLPTPLLASLIEEGNNKLYEKGILDSYLKNEKLKNIDTLILKYTQLTKK